MKTDIDIHRHDHFSFDLWLTLIKSHPEFKAKRVELFSSFFNVEKPIDEVAKAVKYYDDLCNNINEVIGGNVDTFEIYLLILNSSLSSLRFMKMSHIYLNYFKNNKICN